MATTTPLNFDLPASRVATTPPEERGVWRDQVRLLVGEQDHLSHTRFDQLPAHLSAGDLLVVNTSPTMPAAVSGVIGGRKVGLHFSQLQTDGLWTVEVRRPDNRGPILDRKPGNRIQLATGSVQLVREEDGQRAGGVRLWRADVRVQGSMRRFLRRHGSPIRYGYVSGAWPLTAYQTVFADICQWPGSAEMASAARPFTRELVTRLQNRGIAIAPISLHAGVSSLEVHEPPRAEPYEVSEATADAVNATRLHGGRVVAVGTTVTRALETVAAENGVVTPGKGWTDLVLGPDRPTRAIDGLITGWHPPEASHLRLLEAVAGQELVARTYEAALESEYLWHEFGDSCLLLPEDPRRR